MFLISYRPNVEGGGCHCHGPDWRRDSDFEMESVSSMEEAIRRAIDLSTRTDRKGIEPGNDQYQHFFVRQAEQEEMFEGVEQPYNWRTSGWAISIDLTQEPAFKEGVKRRTQEIAAAVKAEKDAVEIARKAAREAEERAKLDELKKKYEK